MKPLLASILVLATAGCSSSTQSDDRAQWTARATSVDVVTARTGAEREANFIIAHLPVKSATMASEDSCGVGQSDLWYTSPNQFECYLTTTYYVPADGALLPELAEIDKAARAAPLALIPR
jgi:hypothetical protein